MNAKDLCFLLAVIALTGVWVRSHAGKCENKKVNAGNTAFALAKDRPAILDALNAAGVTQ